MENPIYPKCSNEQCLNADKEGVKVFLPNHPIVDTLYPFLCVDCLKKEGRGRGGVPLPWPPGVTGV